ncbi:alpha/beta fold hydrolase [Cohnella sp. CFH 77786]|uniref:alpha/beta fold hydrolase n=1 Tax=Cohnella sp. CFH 77786 TaxID=2662265 RepID=UPI001C60BAA4|nr:alpha/beta hydrolase [Cohnella sp. CFH 77786]MBW5447142.1 alpha/beta fold hydrolase [Cohnella sp. CFH 77786]
MNKVISKDGTPIVFDKKGNGPIVILVDGAGGNRAFGPNVTLAPLLAEKHTVITYDRRGRGESGDTRPYDLSREIDDIEALIQHTGESAFVYGISSGGALALEAASRLPAIRKLAIYEVPFIVDNSRAPLPPDYLAKLAELVDSGQRGAALKHFMKTGVGLPAILVAMMPLMPGWSKMKSIAHTLIQDTTFMVDLQKGNPLPADRWSSVTMPALILDGGKSPLWVRNAAKSLANILPNAAYQTLEGQTHIVKPAALAPVLMNFFKE